jgi:hypothetical protein
MNPVISQKLTRRDHLGTERERALPLDLTEIGGFARPHQRLQPALFRGAHDLDLEVSTAGRPAAIVGRSAGGPYTWVGPGMNGELPGRSSRGREVSGHQPPGLHDAKSVFRLPPGFGKPEPGPRRGTLKTVGLASRSSVTIFLKVPARDVEDRVGIELIVVAPERPEADPLGMPEQPRRLVIAGPGALVEDGDPKQNRKGGALPAHGAARREGSTSGDWHAAKIGEGSGPVAYSLAGLYICELVHKGAPNPVPGLENQRSHQVREAERR